MWLGGVVDPGQFSSADDRARRGAHGELVRPKGHREDHSAHHGAKAWLSSTPKRPGRASRSAVSITSNNAYTLFRQHQIGSLEPGKLADLIVLDRDLLTCPVDQVRETQVLQTHLAGPRVFSRY